jgi:hypothetical protein
MGAIRFSITCTAAGLLFLMGCGRSEELEAPESKPAAALETARGIAPEAAPIPESLPNGLLIAVSRFERGEDGKPLPKSELVTLVRREGEWRARSYEDPESNVFHKAMVYTPPGGAPAITTLGGTAAAVKVWGPGEAGLVPSQTLWVKDFGGRFSRMRDAEQADLYGDGSASLAVVTHDQGVVAVIRPASGGDFEVIELDQEPDTFIHEVEIGDLDGDGVLEVYTTPSDPNKLDGKPQRGEVVRYVPAKGEGRVVVADLGDRHAKEILVGDVDGDGRDELYVSVEAVEGGALEIRRFDADTDPSGGVSIATLRDPMCRFLTAGDVDGDGKQEMVAAAKDTGLWLLRPAADPRAEWSVSLIDADSKGFEHAALLTDLDGDGTDELYVASDDAREVRRYTWVAGQPARETIYSRPDATPILTWNLMPVPQELVP